MPNRKSASGYGTSLGRDKSGWFGPFKIKEGLGYREDSPVFLDVGADRPAVVDLRYAGLLSTLQWRYDGYYAKTKSYYSIHRLVMGEPKGKEVHHKNEDVFDNRVSNLEALTEAEHCRRHQSKTKKGTSKTKGGSYMSKRGRGETEMTIGYYDTEEAAAMAYDWAARILEGPEAEVNFPDVLVSASAAYMMRTSGGEYFDVGFRKRHTGEFRFLTCRAASPPGPYFMAGRNLIVVKAKGALGYRRVPIEGIEALYIGGRKYKVVR